MSREERWSAFAELVKIDHLELELNHPLHMGLNDLLSQPHKKVLDKIKRNVKLSPITGDNTTNE